MTTLRECADTAAAALAEMLRAGKGDVEDRHSSEYRFRNLDGTYRWLSDEQHLIRDANGEPLEIVGSWSDITQRKAAEHAEDALKARIALLLESAPAVVYSFAASGDFAPIFISENVKRVLGYCPDEYLKNADFWRSRVHPEDLAAVEAEQGKLFELGSHVSEYRFRKKDGTYCWVSDDQHLIRDHRGQPLEVVGSWSEVTARKTAEHVIHASGYRGETRITSDLYDATASQQRKVVEELPDSANRVLIIGHNPGFEELLEGLVGQYVPLSTAALALVELTGETWRDAARQSSGQLVKVWQPRELE